MQKPVSPPPSSSPWSQEERVRTGLVLDWLSLIGPTLFQASNRNGADWAQEDVPLVGLFRYFPWYTVWWLYWVKSNSSTFSQVSNVSVGVCLRPPDPIMFTWSPPRLLWSVGNLEKVASRPPKLPVQCVPSSKCYQKLLTLTLSSLLQQVSRPTESSSDWDSPDVHLMFTWPPDHHLTFPWPSPDP